MADITLGKIKFEFKGKYGAGTTYYKDDVVVYDHMKFIYVNASSGSGNAPLILDTVSGWDNAFPTVNPDNATALKKYRLNSDYWEYFENESAFGEYLGTWAEGTTYDIGDVVTGTYGACYYAVRKSVGDRPELNRYGSWQLLIEGGYVPHERKISRLGPNLNPIGWRGLPNSPITEWTAVGGDDWNGNIPPSLTADEISDDWIADVGVVYFAGFTHTGWDGRPVVHSSTGQYGGPRGATNSKGGYHPMPIEFTQSFIPYWNASLLSTPWWTGGQNNNYSVDANNYVQNVDFFTARPASDPTTEPFGSSTPRIIQYFTVGGYHTTGCLYEDGTVWIQGYFGYMFNFESQPTWPALSIGLTLNRTHFGGKRIVKVATGFGHQGKVANMAISHILFLDEDGNVWTMGNNSYGQCGIGPEYSIGTSAYQETNDIMDSGGFDYSRLSVVDAPVCISLNKDPTGEFHFDSEKVVDIWAAGTQYGVSYALTEDGRLWSWGYNQYGQLGHPTDSGTVNTNRCAAPREVGGANQTLNWADYNGIQKMTVEGSVQLVTCYVLDGDGYMWSWGYNGVGRLGTGDTTNNDNTITLNATDHKRTGWTGLAGSIKNYWTTNMYTSSIQNLWIKKTDNTLWGMGENGQYQLLTGTNTDQYTPVSVDTGIDSGHVVKITGVGDGTYCNIFALTTTGKVYVIPMGVMPNGFGATASQLQNNYNVHQRDGESQYSWKAIALPRGLSENGTIIDIRSEAQYHTEGGSTYSERVFTALTEDGRMYMMNNGGGGGSAMGIQAGTAGVGPTNAVWWGS